MLKDSGFRIQDFGLRLWTKSRYGCFFELVLVFWRLSVTFRGGSYERWTGMAKYTKRPATQLKIDAYNETWNWRLTCI
jgi:hypothetical protein